MYEGRDLGGLATARLDDSEVEFYSFVRFDFPSPTGTIYYTNKPGGYNGDVGDGSGVVQWAEYDVKVQSLSSSEQTILDVSYIDVANVDNTWSTLVLNVGVEMRPIVVVQGWFGVTTGAISGKPKLYSGRMELARVKNGVCNISIVPHRYGLSQMLPARVIGPTCGYIYGDARTCQATAGTIISFPTCDHSRQACTQRSNLAHFGGEDLIPTAPVVWRRIT